MIQFESIGGYRILRVLGEGGMGRVYEALQTEPVRRRVALKVLGAGGGGEAVASRFAAVQQALALMNHPGIAKVFDAGTTKDGRQWFAMELVAGQALTDFADREKLDLPSRVALFARVCHAVQHAHQKGIIHRDLKPSNILVGEGDTGPEPKVIDFGVAKAMDLRLTEETLVTQFGAVIGTPAYMSPEQAEGTSLDIDTRADVYSLGVVLFELLVGCLPVDPVETGYVGFIAYLKSPDTDPPTPSDRFTTLDPERQRAEAARRVTSPARLRERLSGDLGWIVMTALEKARSRRYESAGALAADLERYLRREPVSARPPSTAYQLRKFVSRNRIAVAAAASVVLALTLGAAGATIGMVRARREATQARNQAEIARRESETSSRVSDFLASLFAEASPQQSRGREVTVRDMLDRAATRIQTDLANEPAVQGRLMGAIGRAYTDIGRYEQARPLLEGALARAEQGGDPEEIAGSQHDLGYLLTFLSDFQEADSLLRASLATFERVEGPGADWTTTVVSNLAFNSLRWGRNVAQADSMLAAMRPAEVATLGEAHPKVALAAYTRCWTLRELGRRVAADSACAVSLDLVKRSLGPDAPQVVYNTLAIGHVRRALGRWAEAREAYRAAEALNRQLHPGGHEETAYALLATAETWLGQGVPDSALTYARAGVAMMTRVLGSDNTELAEGQETLAKSLAAARRFDEAEALIRRVLAVDSARVGVESQRYARHLSRLGEMRLQQGDFAGARAIQDRSLAIMERHVEAGSPHLVAALADAGAATYRAGDAPEAERLLRRALAITGKAPDDYAIEHPSIEAELALVLVDRAEFGEACPLARRAGDRLRTVLGAAHWRTAWADAVAGHCLAESGRAAEGGRQLRTALTRLEATRRPGDLQRHDAKTWLEVAGLSATSPRR